MTKVYIFNKSNNVSRVYGDVTATSTATMFTTKDLPVLVHQMPSQRQPRRIFVLV